MGFLGGFFGFFWVVFYCQPCCKAVLTWYRSSGTPAHVRLACHLLSVWVDALGLAALRPDLPAVLAQLPAYVGGREEGADSLTVQALGLLLRLVRADPGLLTQAGQAALWERVHAALLHSHAWVRLQAAQLLGRSWHCLNSLYYLLKRRKNTGTSRWLRYFCFIIDTGHMFPVPTHECHSERSTMTERCP